MCQRRVFHRCVSLFILVLCFVFPITVLAANVPDKVLKAAESVVFIECGVGKNISCGSGFIVYKDKSGTYIATNNHVIEDGIETTFVWISDSIREKAKVVARSESQDLAVLHLDIEMDAKPLLLNRNAKQGEEAFAIGFPAGADILSSSIAHVGNEATITSGIISSIRNSNLIYDTAYIKILQINVDINAGNSGGPLLNSKGEVIGVNAFGVIDTQGINGAISSEELISVINAYRLFDVPHNQSSFIYIITIVIGVALPVGAIWIVFKRKQSNYGRAIPLHDYLSLLSTPLDCNSAVSLLMPIAQTIKRKHDSGSICLRVFPANIGVTKSGCQLFEKNDRPTEQFLSPEQRKGAFSGIPADIYAFCAVLKYMLEYQQNGSESETNTQENFEIHRIVKKGLAEKISSRYSSMQELIYDLAPFNTGISTDALQPFHKKRRRLTLGVVPIPSSNPLVTAEETPKSKITITRISAKRLCVLIVSITALFCVVFMAFATISRNVALKNLDSLNFDQAVKIFYRIPLGTVIFPNEQAYFSAAKLVTSGKFDDARAAFEALGNYRRAKKAIYEVGYKEGQLAISNGDFSQASEAFGSLGAYKDAVTLEKYARYLQASDLATNSKYDDALDILFDLVQEKYEPAKTLLFDVSVEKAAQLAESGSFGDAYQTLLKVKDFGNAAELISEYRDEAYKTGIAYYRQGYYQTAIIELDNIGSYLNAEEYVFLSNFHNFYCGKTFCGFPTKREMMKLKALIGFEDVNQLLLNNQYVAKMFLEGNWRGDGCYFTMEADGHISYNLPYISYGEYYRIEDGAVLKFYKKDENATKNLFRFNVITKDCIEVFAYKNGKYYTLYRE